MAIITISRELAALGDETAHELARLLKYRFVDKQGLEERMRQLGGNVKPDRYDERRPAFFAAFSQDRDSYLHYLKSAVFAEAGAGDCVFMGRGCAAILAGIPGVLSVFLAAPPEIRLERVKGYFHCDERRARQIIEESDRGREGFHRYFFDTKWRTPASYGISLNTGSLHPEASAGIIKAVLDKLVDAEAETACALRLKDLLLGQQIVQRILFEKSVPIHFLEAHVSAGDVVLFGVANSQPAIETAVQLASEVPSVRQVRPEIQVVQEFSVMP